MRETYATASVMSVAAKNMIPDVPEGRVYSTAKPIVVSFLVLIENSVKVLILPII